MQAIFFQLVLKANLDREPTASWQSYADLQNDKGLEGVQIIFTVEEKNNFSSGCVIALWISRLLLFEIPRSWHKGVHLFSSLTTWTQKIFDLEVSLTNLYLSRCETEITVGIGV